MIVVKLPILKFLKKPMDFNIRLKDGNRLFGENKTWKGCFSMIILSVILTVIWGLVCKTSLGLENNNLFYVKYENILIYNIIIGLLLGIAYIVFELPNSFIKRRINIKERKNKNRINRKIVYCN